MQWHKYDNMIEAVIDNDRSSYQYEAVKKLYIYPSHNTFNMIQCDTHIDADRLQSHKEIPLEKHT